MHLTGSFTLAAGAQQALPFSVEVPWETPVTRFYGTPLHGMTMGVRTELSVAKSVDKTDIDSRYWEKHYYLVADGDEADEGYVARAS